MTVKELADRVLDARAAAWAESDVTTAIAASEHLGPEDEQTVRRVVADAGYQGEEFEQMVRQVTARVVGRVEALADNLPAAGGD